MSEAARIGQIAYRVRYRPSLSPSNKPLSVSGYGVELALKRTDYIVIDDRDDKDAKDSKPAAVQEYLSFKADDVEDLQPLSASELLGLGLKTSSYIMSQEDPLEALEKVLQDFPKHSSAISKLNSSDDFIAEHRANRAKFAPAGYNGVWINGLQVDTRQMNAFALLDRLRHERKLMKGFMDVGLTAQEAVSLISHSALTEGKESGEVQRYDYRDALEGGQTIIWLNDLEKDKRYEEWSSHPSALLQRTFPGQLPPVRKDIHNVVVPLDLVDPKDLGVLVNNLQVFVTRMIPIRFGFVPLVRSPESEKQSKIAYYLKDAYGLSALMKYLSASLADKQGPKFKDDRLEKVIHEQELRPGKTARTVADVLEAEDLKQRIESTNGYLKRLGLDGQTALANGAAVPKNDALLQYVSERVAIDVATVQRTVYEEGPSEDLWLAGVFLEGASASRNALIIPEDESSVAVVDLGRIIREHARAYEEAPKLLPTPDGMKQFWSQVVLVADLDSESGQGLLKQALAFKEQQSELLLVVIHSPSEEEGKLNPISGQVFDALAKGVALDMERLWTILENADSKESRGQANQMAEAFWLRMQPLVQALEFEPGQNGLLLNGRKVGPVPQDAEFKLEDFQALLAYERSKRITPVNTALTALDLEDKLGSALSAARLTSLVALSGKSDVPEGIFESASALRTGDFHLWKTEHSAIVKGDSDATPIQIVASVDPTTELAQRWVPILRVLSELGGVHLKLFLNPREKLQEIPVKRFYRHVLSAAPRFDEEGSVTDLKASFEGLPRQALLNLALDVPPAWLVAPKEAVQDLDNIKLSALKPDASVSAIYELEHILIEGHSRDVTTSQPPRGAQLLLGTEVEHHFADTLIMANLGYFQFKANPGFWNIRLKPGMSEQIFKIDSIGAEGHAPREGDETTEVALMSFQGKTLYPRLSRKSGQEDADVLEEGAKAGTPADVLAKASKFATSILSSVGVKPKSEHADINIFSVASGHLYERMLNIMMVSVMRHTKHTVKFWFIEQFLSPAFKETLPHLASAYKFDYEMVTYKWPHWLRGQREKQREIWGYKILFLDVLFPLSLDKVIFVDADQIVRTNMHDLVALDLHGAPYGFTPMCDSREEMEGYRFWKQGYWANTLRGRPYHISALYVVDLRRFRQLAAGDRLRGSYHQLSADPASLSNLDQDLPNNLQGALPIHSLPQEWLWCETWCSDESLKEARTIDLCNNPETKEPKLARARRQVPEWTEYDDEIAELFRRVREEERKGSGEEGGAKVQEEMDSEGGRKEKIKDEL